MRRTPSPAQPSGTRKQYTKIDCHAAVLAHADEAARDGRRLRRSVHSGSFMRPNVAFGASDAPNATLGALDAPNATLGRLGQEWLGEGAGRALGW